MKVIDSIRKATEEIIDDMKWPGRKRGIARAFESVKDAVEAKKLEVEAQLIDLEKQLCGADETAAREIIKRMDDLDVEIEETEAMAARVAKRQERLFGDVKEEK